MDIESLTRAHILGPWGAHERGQAQASEAQASLRKSRLGGRETLSFTLPRGQGVEPRGF